MTNWKVTTNCIDGEFMYAVCRIKNPNEPMHSGNLEFATSYMTNKQEAERIAENLNKTQGDVVLWKFV